MSNLDKNRLQQLAGIITEAKYASSVMWIVYGDQHKLEPNIIGPFSTRQQAEHYMENLKHHTDVTGDLSVRSLKLPDEFLDYVKMIVYHNE